LLSRELPWVPKLFVKTRSGNLMYYENGLKTSGSTRLDAAHPGLNSAAISEEIDAHHLEAGHLTSQPLCSDNQ
jgi:hypothetical protein